MKQILMKQILTGTSFWAKTTSELVKLIGLTPGGIYRKKVYWRQPGEPAYLVVVYKHKVTKFVLENRKYETIELGFFLGDMADTETLTRYTHMWTYLEANKKMTQANKSTIYQYVDYPGPRLTYLL